MSVGLEKHPAKAVRSGSQSTGRSRVLIKCRLLWSCRRRGKWGSLARWRSTGAHAHGEGPAEITHIGDGPTHHARGTRWDASTLGRCQEVPEDISSPRKVMGSPICELEWKTMIESQAVLAPSL